MEWGGGKYDWRRSRGWENRQRRKIRVNRGEGTVQDREGEDEGTPEDDTASDWLHSTQMSEYKFTVREHVPPPSS